MSSYEGHLKNLLDAWQGNTEASRGKEGDPVNLSSSHSDIGITINFHLERHAEFNGSKGDDAWL